jgi:hypothetical protein
MQVRGGDDVGIGASVDGAIVVVVLGKSDPLDSGELLPGNERWSFSSPKQG